MSPHLEDNSLSGRNTSYVEFASAMSVVFVYHIVVSYMSVVELCTWRQAQVPNSYIIFPLSKDLVNKSITLVTDLVSQPRLADVTQ